MNYPGYSNEEIGKIVAYAIASDCEKGRRRFEAEFHKEAPPARTVRDWKTRFLETLSVIPRSSGHKQQSNRISDEKRNQIVTAFGDGACSSQRDGSMKFHVSQPSVCRILKDSDLKAYKYTLVQELKEEDYNKRLDFCRLVIDRTEADRRWMERIIFSDEATLHLNGTINCHNCYYYSAQNDHRIMEKPLKSPSILIWAMVPYDGRLRFHIQFGTMNSDQYATILTDIVFPTLNNVRYQHHMYQQDGASIHWSLIVRHHLNERLPNRWIGRSGPIEWPPRSPDLTVNDFWLWGYLRDNVYREPRPTTLDELSAKCQHFLENIDHIMVKRTFDNFYKRCKLCFNNNGGHIEQFL